MSKPASRTVDPNNAGQLSSDTSEYVRQPATRLVGHLSAVRLYSVCLGRRLEREQWQLSYLCTGQLTLLVLGTCSQETVRRIASGIATSSSNCNSARMRPELTTTCCARLRATSRCFGIRCLRQNGKGNSSGLRLPFAIRAPTNSALHKRCKYVQPPGPMSQRA